MPKHWIVDLWHGIFKRVEKIRCVKIAEYDETGMHIKLYKIDKCSDILEIAEVFKGCTRAFIIERAKAAYSIQTYMDTENKDVSATIDDLSKDIPDL